MPKKAGKMSVFDMVKEGLEDSVAYSKGKLSLVTTTVPAPAPEAGPKKIAAIRKRLNMSQAVFAATLNVSTKAVQSWEQGIRFPREATLRLLEIIDRKPEIITSVLGKPARAHSKVRYAMKKTPSRTVAKKKVHVGRSR